MRTNSKQVKQAIQAHILDRINSDEKELKTDAEKLQYFVDCFNSEYVHADEIKRYGKGFNLWKNYIQGLPSCIDLEWEYWLMIEFLESIGLKQPDNKDENDSADLYYHLVWRELNVLLRRNKIKLFK